jgi:hypothetical protein
VHGAVPVGNTPFPAPFDGAYLLWPGHFLPLHETANTEVITWQ